ncbi:MAG: hypothetical protein R3C56_16165 [Pirellulaceae bacterium]
MHTIAGIPSVSTVINPACGSRMSPCRSAFCDVGALNPAQANRLLDLAQRDIDDTWHYYEQLAGVERAYSDLVDSR